MCLAKVYVRKDSERELIMQEIAFVEVGDKKLLLSTVFGEQREVEANVKEINFANSTITLEKLRLPEK
ncbi:MAG: CooT family nickel-binding protein [Chloroflexi bacterium]|nr:CooT family nickel-binding protein [Chloroflexota bacterium]